MHRRPTPRAGGLALFPAVILAFALSGSGLFLALTVGGGLMIAAGISDDVIGLSPLHKLSAQASAALLTLVIGKELLLPSSASVAQMSFAFLWIVTLTNAFNLIDGLDGLCAGVGAVACIFIFAVSEKVEALILLAAIVGFLPFNRHPAKGFLGDSGAMLIGFFTAVLSLPMLFNGGGAKGLLSAVMIFALPLFDTVFAFVRRILSGSSPFLPDRKHLHHRLVDSGLFHSSVSRFEILMSAACGSVGALFYRFGPSPLPVVCFGLLLSACGCIALFFAASRPPSF